MNVSGQSAGILLYRLNSEKQTEVFLVHPGGPFWAKKDEGAWGIPKGEFANEDPLAAAKREFMEETGFELPGGRIMELAPVKLKSGKVVHAWAVEGDIDAAAIKSNFFELEWPPKSGKFINIPEVDKGGWFTISKAKEKINTGQIALLDQLTILLQN